jgi:hypothetical protein
MELDFLSVTPLKVRATRLRGSLLRSKATRLFVGPPEVTVQRKTQLHKNIHWIEVNVLKMTLADCQQHLEVKTQKRDCFNRTCKWTLTIHDEKLNFPLFLLLPSEGSGYEPFISGPLIDCSTTVLLCNIDFFYSEE